METQPISSQTQKEMIGESQPCPPIVWGRIYGKSCKITAVDLTETEYNVGRGYPDDYKNMIQFTENNLSKRFLLKTSNNQFTITRDITDLYKPVYIQDNSRHGTFINGQLIGRNKRMILADNDIISILDKDFRAFKYSDLSPLTPINRVLPSEISSKYLLSRELGDGASGTVNLCYDRRTSKEYAIKKVQKQQLSMLSVNDNPDATANYSTKVLNEANIMKKLNHPNIIKLYDIKNTPLKLFMIMEFMEGGTLLRRIHDNGYFPEKLTKFYFYQICSAIKYLHELNVTHRDIKPDNMLLRSNDDETLLKISDFGLSKFVDNDTNMKTACGTYFYVAPEVIFNSNRAYTKKVDIWSLGVVLYACLTGALPFRYQDNKISIESLKKGIQFDAQKHIWNNTSTGVRELLQSIFNLKPNNRPSIDDILENNWLQLHHDQQQLLRSLINSEFYGSLENIKIDDAIHFSSDPQQPQPPPIKRRRISNQ